MYWRWTSPIAGRTVFMATSRHLIRVYAPSNGNPAFWEGGSTRLAAIPLRRLKAQTHSCPPVCWGLCESLSTRNEWGRREEERGSEDWLVSEPNCRNLVANCCRWLRFPTNRT